ncbi:MAG: hypothetical protein J0M12_01015 [Deltaproteobacteria bacterium]|nr:hypothetical protein [Deltaproteobacteria bacterium]
MKFPLRMLGLAMFLVCSVALSACSGRTTTVDTQVTTTEQAASADAPKSTKTVEVTKETTEKDEGGHGVFHILGDILALPFRAIGALFTAIF